MLVARPEKTSVTKRTQVLSKIFSPVDPSLSLGVTHLKFSARLSFGFLLIWSTHLDSLDNPHRLPIKISMDWNGFKFILNNDYGKPPEHYLPVPPPLAQVELYDKNNDPHERHNIAEQNKDIVREFIDKIYQVFESSAEWGKKKRRGNLPVSIASE